MATVLGPYEIGDAVRLGNYSTSAGAAFTNLAGVATNPTAVTLTVDKPDGTTLVYGWPGAGANGTLTNESAGRFYFDVTLDQAVVWWCRLVGTGTVVAVSEWGIACYPSRVL
jgi:hypothetical protein